MLSRRTFLALPAWSIFLPLASSPPPPPLAPGRPLRLIWVWPAGETLTPEAARAARWEIQQALQYWNAQAPFPGVYVAREEAIALSDPYAWWDWLKSLHQPGILTAAVIVNATSRQLVNLGGGVHAPAYHWPGSGTMFVSLASSPAYREIGVGALLAHELGHALYAYPDDAQVDPIMADVADAWDTWRTRACR